MHPRFYGTFPRILGHYVREKQALSLEDAIRKMTYLPALKLQLKDRGLLKKGYQTDIVVFDESRIVDTAAVENPHQYPLCIHHVLVNGQRVYQMASTPGDCRVRFWSEDNEFLLLALPIASCYMTGQSRRSAMRLKSDKEENWFISLG